MAASEVDAASARAARREKALLCKELALALPKGRGFRVHSDGHITVYASRSAQRMRSWAAADQQQQQGASSARRPPAAELNSAQRRVANRAAQRAGQPPPYPSRRVEQRRQQQNAASRSTAGAATAPTPPEQPQAAAETQPTATAPPAPTTVAATSPAPPPQPISTAAMLALLPPDLARPASPAAQGPAAMTLTSAGMLGAKDRPPPHKGGASDADAPGPPKKTRGEGVIASAMQAAAPPPPRSPAGAHLATLLVAPCNSAETYAERALAAANAPPASAPPPPTSHLQYYPAHLNWPR